MCERPGATSGSDTCSPSPSSRYLAAAAMRLSFHPSTSGRNRRRITACISSSRELTPICSNTRLSRDP